MPKTAADKQSRAEQSDNNNNNNSYEKDCQQGFSVAISKSSAPAPAPATSPPLALLILHATKQCRKVEIVAKGSGKGRGWQAHHLKNYVKICDSSFFCLCCKSVVAHKARVRERERKLQALPYRILQGIFAFQSSVRNFIINPKKKKSKE